MLARLAENLFWAGRYLERAADTARLLDITYHGLLESPLADPRKAWRSVLSSLGQLASYEETGQSYTDAAVTAYLVTDGSNPGSIASASLAVRDNVRQLREQVSIELWEAVNGLHLELGRRDLEADVEERRFELFSTIKLRCQTIAGVADETMARDDGWQFFQLSRQLERAIMTARLIDVHFHALPDDGTVAFHQWRNLLRSAAAFEAYNRAHPGRPDPRAAVDYLLLNRDHPRSILFCLREAEAGLEQLESPDPTHPARQATGRARALLEFSSDDERWAGDRQVFVRGLVDGIQGAISAVVNEYFAPARPATLHSYDSI